MSTPNRHIPYVPENTDDPAAGLNLSLNFIDALLQPAVVSMALTAPPGSPNDGDCFIPASPATGLWTGLEDYLVRFVEEGGYYQQWVPGTEVSLITNLDDGGLYKFAQGSPGSWVQVGSSESPTSTVVTTADAEVDATADNKGNYTRFTNSGAVYVFDDGESLPIGAEYHGRNAGAGTVTITEAGGMTINPPFGGTLVIPPGGTFTVKIVDTAEADLMGQTVAA